MTNGLFNDIFVQAEVDYRQDRAVIGSHRTTRLERSRHHVRWPRHAETARRHSQAAAH